MTQYKDTTQARPNEHGANGEHLDSKKAANYAKAVNEILTYLFLAGVLLMITHCQPIAA